MPFPLLFFFSFCVFFSLFLLLTSFFFKMFISFSEFFVISFFLLCLSEKIWQGHLLTANHCSFLSTATFKMASEALMAKKGRGVMYRKCFTLASKCFDKLLAFPNKDEGSCFPSYTGGFSPISKVGIQCLVSTMLFGTWLGTIRITWGKSPERLFRYLRFSKRATVGVLTTYATRWNSGMKRVRCGWTQPLFHKVSNHWFSGRNLKG